MTDEQKQGAALFFTSNRDGGAGCLACHNGNTFTDSRHHLVAFPQIGVGKGNATATSTTHDFGRENITNNADEKYHFRTPTLLNIASTALYGHSGSYQTLEEVVGHYNNPQRAVDRLFAAQGGQAFTDGVAPYCELPQIRDLMLKHNQNCENIFSDAFTNSIEVVNYLQDAINNNAPARAPLRARPNLSPNQISQLVAFLNALTDPCVESLECLSPWLLNDNDIATFPDEQVLEATDKLGRTL